MPVAPGYHYKSSFVPLCGFSASIPFAASGGENWWFGFEVLFCFLMVILFKMESLEKNTLFFKQ
jgi:hypothetical protein